MIDGLLCAKGQQVVSVFDRGFLYGDSVFETIRTYGGEPFELENHLSRLQQSAALVYIPLPVPLAQLDLEVRAALENAENSESYIRVMLTRGEGALGLDPSLAGVPRRVVIVSPLNRPADEMYQSGIRAVSYLTQRHTDATVAAGAKVGNYLISVLAMRKAKEDNAGEALIVDASGNVLEGASSNVFLVNGTTLTTPGTDSGILAGVTRRHILEIAPRCGLSVNFAQPSLQEVMEADEVFVSSSIRELMPVTCVDGKAIGTGSAGPITLKLLKAFRARALGSH